MKGSWKDRDKVMDKWKNDFASLLKKENLEINNKYKENLIAGDEKLDQWSSEGVDELNRDITYEEVKRVVERSKNKKAAGANCITNELLKSVTIIETLYVLFRQCYRCKLVPEV